MNKPRLNPRWIHLLLTIKQACVVNQETGCEEYFADMKREEEENQAFYDLFEGYTPDIMTDEHIADVKALVKKWNEDHEEEDTE